MGTNKFNQQDNYEKKKEPKPVAGGWAESRWYTGTVIGLTSKFDKPRYLCIRMNDNSLVLLNTLKELPGFFDAKPGTLISAHGTHSDDDYPSPFGVGIVVSYVDELTEGGRPIERVDSLEIRGSSEWIPISEIAKAAGISTETIRRRIEAGEIEASRRGGRNWYVKRELIERAKNKM